MVSPQELVSKYGEKLNGYYVSVYQIENLYGGPEEGGWWYDWYTYLGAVYHETEDAAEKAAEKTREQASYTNEQGKQDRANATANMPEGNSPYLDTEGYIPVGWGDGGKLTVRIEQYPPGELAEDQERPHYC
jgi:hypothetical protein